MTDDSKKKSPDELTVFGVALAIIFFCTIYLYHGRKGEFPALAAALGLDVDVDLWGGLFQCGAAFILLLVPAFILAVRACRLRPADFGFTIGDWKTGLKFTLPIVVLVFPVMLLTGSKDSAICGAYPLSTLAAGGLSAFVAWETCYLVYYVAWEGLFRGVMQLGLQRRLGVLQVMLLQTALSTLLHAGGPELETLGALIAGPLFGYLALRTNSILYVLVIHWALGIATDLSCLVAT